MFTVIGKRGDLEHVYEAESVSLQESPRRLLVDRPVTQDQPNSRPFAMPLQEPMGVFEPYDTIEILNGDGNKVRGYTRCDAATDAMMAGAVQSSTPVSKPARRIPPKKVN
jgi:hypothetical protein